MLRLQGDKDGNFFAALSSPSPVRGSITGSIRDSYIDASCSDIFVDLAALWALVPPVRGFGLGGGFVNARFDIRGPLDNPEFFGSARANSVRLQVPGFIPADIRPVPSVLTIEGREVRFGPVQAAVGNGAGVASGQFLFDGWVPNFFYIDINVPRTTPIPFGLEIADFIANGDAAGNLVIAMDNMNFSITGDLHGNNAEMSISNEDFLFPQHVAVRHETELFENTRIPMVVDLTITTGPAVEFFWPSVRFPVLRASPVMGTILHIAADSVARQFSINSDIRIRGGELFYFQRSFYIRSGNLLFRENEQEFNPRLSARAELRERTNDGPVTISMIVENEPLLNFVPRFESSPMLSQLEIFELLGESVVGGVAGGGDTVQRLAGASAGLLANHFLMIRQFERFVRNHSPLDMFSIRTQAAQNFAFNMIDRNINMIDRRGRLGNYFDNTTVFGGRYIGNDMFIQGMFSMRYDDRQLGFGGMRFEPDIGIELQSPLFNIRWDFVPTNPQNWWVSDSSITFTWSWSF